MVKAPEPDVVQVLARHVVNCRYEELPLQAVKAAKMSILDTLGVMLAASGVGEGCKEIAELAADFGGKSESSIIGFGQKVPCYLAAWVNGALCHPLDYDDTHEAALCHPTAETLPAAMAIAERLGHVTGRQLITSVAVGTDLVSRIGMAVKTDASSHGWLTASVFGYLGGAAAAGKVLGLTVEQMVDALGIAFCQASGSFEMRFGLGSAFSGIRDGFSQKSGVLSALLAQRGITGPKNSLEGPAGLYKLYFKGEYDRSVITNDLGRRFEGVNISYKPWPAILLLHPYVDSALSLRGEHNLAAADIEEAIVTVNDWGKAMCEPREEKIRPINAMGAKYSLPFAVAAALAHGKVVIADFTPEGINNPETLAMARRVTYSIDNSFPAKRMPPGIVKIKLRDGRVLSRVTERSYGSPERPMTESDMLDKFRDCVKYAVKPLSKSRVDRLVETVRTLEKQLGMSGLIPVSEYEEGPQ